MNQKDKKTNLMYIKIETKRNKLYALIDSGAAVNCIGPALIHKVDIVRELPDRQVVEGIGGSVSTFGIVTVRLTLPTSDVLEIDFVVVEGLNEIILLGLPFLKNIKAKIDFINNIMYNMYGNIRLLSGYIKSANAAIW